MKIQILGSGCATCKKLHEMVEIIVKENGGKDIVEYLTGDAGTDKIIDLGVMGSPVLLVDGKVAMVGFVPDKNKIKNLIYSKGCGDDCECNQEKKECSCGGAC